MAEARVMDRSPEAWLRYGPGRSTQDSPGWTETYAPEPDSDEILVPVETEIDTGRLARILNHLIEVGALDSVTSMRANADGTAVESNKG